jgi:hypothetical protein
VRTPTINAAALARLVCRGRAGSAIRDPLSLGIALGSFLVLWRTGLNTAWLIAAGGAIGLGRLALGT